MTRRLVLVIVATVAATLLVVGGTTFVFATLEARSRTESDLRELAASINEGLAQSGQAAGGVRPIGVAAFRRALRLDGIELMTVTRGGRLLGNRPDGVPEAGLDPTALAAGTTESGRSGSLVWVADPVQVRNRTVVTVVTRHAGSGLADTAGWFLLASLLTLAVGAGVAVVVGRRLGRPVRQADDAARRIAAGELSTRLTPPKGRHGDELVDLAQAINTMAESLERSKVLEQQFLLSVSHDLRTPLTSIRGYAEAISDGTAPDVGRAAAVITRESRRLERLVADLLDLARLDARSFSLVPVDVDLGHAAEGAVTAAQPQAERLGLTYTVAVPPQRVTVSADPERLGQVIANLLENAQRFARSAVTVTVAEVDGRAQFAVEDDGPGIADEDLPHVFERLYVSAHRPTRSENGSGLGLAIVRQLVSAMGGTVRAERATSGGARLVVSLPSAGAGAGDRAGAPLGEADAATTPDRSGARSSR
jgi:signal transduction histidine kinase